MEAASHRRGPLVDMLLAPMISSLTFMEIVDRVLDEDQWQRRELLVKLQGCRTRIQGELDDLIEACRAESDASAWRRLKRR